MNTAGKNNHSYQNKFRPRYSGGFSSPTHHQQQQQQFNYHDYRPKASSNNCNNQGNYTPRDPGPSDNNQPSPPTVPILSSALYPVLPSSTITVNPTVPSDNSSPTSSLSTTGTSEGTMGPAIRVPSSSSGNYSGPASGGSGQANSGDSADTLVNPMATNNSEVLQVDNWQPEPDQGSNQQRSTYRGQESRGNEFTAFIGSLDYSITSEVLESTFKARYPSVTSGKVILQETGESKGFGFVRFSSQIEYRKALVECADAPLFGGRGIRISEAHPKPTRSHYAGSVNSGDGGSQYAFGNRGPRMPTQFGRDIGVSNGSTMAHGVGNKHGGPGGNKGVRSSNFGDNPNFDQQKRAAQMEAIAQVRNWYPGQSGQSSGPSSNHASRHPNQSPRAAQEQLLQTMAGMSLNGAPIILPPEGMAAYHPGYWTPNATQGAYGQAMPAGYPVDGQYATSPPQQAWWPGPNGQAAIMQFVDPSQVYAGMAADYSAMATPGQVPTPYPRIPYNEQTAHMFAPQAMMQPVPQSNNGIMAQGQQHGHYPAGGDVQHAPPGGPTPPSDNEHGNGMNINSNNGWVQN